MAGTKGGLAACKIETDACKIEADACKTGVAVFKIAPAGLDQMTTALSVRSVALWNPHPHPHPST